jgi:hypothetical protein
VVLPIVILIVAIPLLKAYFKIKFPTPRSLGRVLPKLCVVAADEIMQYNEILAEELRSKLHLRRTLRRNQIRINRAYLAQMAWNIFLFQQVVRFEAMKIDPGKSSFDYEPREVLLLDLVEESAQLRWEAAWAQLGLLGRAVTGLAVHQETLTSLLGKYKQLEQDIIALAGMAEDNCYQQMLVERLGLAGWDLIDGGSSTPA